MSADKAAAGRLERFVRNLTREEPDAYKKRLAERSRRMEDLLRNTRTSAISGVSERETAYRELVSVRESAHPSVFGTFYRDGGDKSGRGIARTLERWSSLGLTKNLDFDGAEKVFAKHTPQSPQALLDALHIEIPDRIDVEFIAEHCNATVVYEPLDDCSAQLDWAGAHAYITVDENTHRQRQRFSIAHELGHWVLHRANPEPVCTTRSSEDEDVDRRNQLEHEANRFAVELLLPESMVRPLIADEPADLGTARMIARKFKVGLQMAAARVAELSPRPAIFLRFAAGKRTWKAPNVKFPRGIMVREEFNKGTLAFRLVAEKETRLGPALVNAYLWFDHENADLLSSYLVAEESEFRPDERWGDVLITLIEWTFERTEDPSPFDPAATDITPGIGPHFILRRRWQKEGKSGPE